MEDYTVGACGHGDVMESTKTDCTKPGQIESRSGGPMFGPSED